MKYGCAVQRRESRDGGQDGLTAVSENDAARGEGFTIREPNGKRVLFALDTFDVSALPFGARGLCLFDESASELVRRRIRQSGISVHRPGGIVTRLAGVENTHVP